MKRKIFFTALSVILFSFDLSSQTNMKILSYNVLMGFQGDSVNQAKYVTWVKEIDPDIIAYQEMNGFTPQSIEKFAARYGHSYAVISKTEGFPVALSSKYPIVNVQKVVDNMWHAYLYAHVDQIHVFVIHFSPFSYQKRQLEVKEVLAHAALIPKNEKIVIMGDFNSLAEEDDDVYDKTFIQIRKEREDKHSHIRNLNDGKPDYTVTGAMKEAGYTDVIRLFHEDFQKSAPTKKYGSQTFQRIDYVWVNPGLLKQLRYANFIYDHVTDSISDHYPLLVTLKLK